MHTLKNMKRSAFKVRTLKTNIFFSPKHLKWYFLLILFGALTGLKIHAQENIECTIQLSDILMEYGTLSIADENNSRNSLKIRNLETRSANLSVSCPSPKNIVFSITGNSTGEKFSFGSHGGATIKLSDVTLDGKPTTIFKNNSNQSHESVTTKSLTLVPGDIVHIGNAEEVKGSVFISKIEVTTEIPEIELYSREKKDITGKILFELVN